MKKRALAKAARAGSKNSYDELKRIDPAGYEKAM